MPSDGSSKSPWTIRLTSHAARDLDRIHEQDAPLHRQLLEALTILQTHPFPAPPKCKKLRGLNGLFWRLRVGAYRLVYRPIEPHILLILRIIPRRELERVLKAL